MKPIRKLEHKSEEQVELQSTSEQQQKAREFGSAEEMLRCDAERTEVPAEIGARLRESIANETPPRRNWWQRMFGK